MLRSTAAIAALCALPSMGLAAVPGFSDFFVFGDSLSDPFVEGLVGSPIYPNAQFTNGDTWAVQLGADAASGTNFAQAGATASDNGDDIDDFAAQISAFVAQGNVLGSTSLAAVWFGGNDVGEAALTAVAGGDPVARITEGVIAAATGITQLNALGFENILLFGVPNIGVTPRLQNISAEAGAGATLLSQQFNASLQPLLPAGANIAFVDTFALLEQITADPAAAGFSNVTDPCFDGVAAFCGLENADSFLYFDPFHPTEPAHSLLAEAALSAVGEIAPVPLPAAGWLMGAALGGLLVWRRRPQVAAKPV